MSFNFDAVVNRKHTNSYKWDSEDENTIPMWVADMDFKTAPEIIEALLKRVEHGIFGYAKVPETYYTKVQDWFSTQHQFYFEKEWILYTTGVVPALSAIIRALTQAGYKVLIQEPVYNCFFSSIKNQGCTVVSNNLLYTNNAYTIDFDDLALKASDPKVKVMLLCNPHNPVGRVWTKDELLQIGNICLEHNVFVIADEIHCDLVYNTQKHIPFASLNNQFLQNSATCIAPSKTFNLAGLQAANIVVENTEIRNRIDKAINIHETCDISPFAVEAVIAAYTYGNSWLTALKQYLWDNYIWVQHFMNTQLPKCAVMELEGTYLVWIDVSYLNMSVDEIASSLQKNEKVHVTSGTTYGKAGEHFIRVNIACPRKTLEEGFERIKIGLKALERNNL